jgi:Tfp pilus assembly protein PilV
MTRLPRRLPSRSRRPGLSLLEVVISLAILLFSIVAIMQLISMGSDRALDVQHQAIGSMLAQRKMAELMVGATPLGSSGYTAFTDEGMENWQWKVDATQNSINGVWNVEVSVKYEAPESNGNNAPTVQLGQMVLDPTLRGSTLDAPPVQTANNSSSSSSSSSPSTSSPSSNSPNKTSGAGGGGAGGGGTGGVGTGGGGARGAGAGGGGARGGGGGARGGGAGAGGAGAGGAGAGGAGAGGAGAGGAGGGPGR